MDYCEDKGEEESRQRKFIEPEVVLTPVKRKEGGGLSRMSLRQSLSDSENVLASLMWGSKVEIARREGSK